MTRLHTRLLLIVPVCLGILPELRSVEPIRPDRFDQWHALIRPGKDEEKWLQIPWQTNLWDARQKAAREGKPILIWEMDGHPLGCV
jgi:hypothetical protein